MDTTVMTSQLQPSMTHPITTDYVHPWKESINADEIFVIVFVQQVLARNFNVIELLKSKFAEMRAIVLQVVIWRPTI